jgi:hypothetical protein
MKQTRTDIHRPSAIVPDEYYDIAFLPHGDGMGSCMARIVEMEKINKHMAKTGGRYAPHEHGGSCDVCGANALTLVVFYHQKSNEYIRVGSICADKLGLGYDKNGLSLFKIAMKEATEFKAGKAKAEAVLKGLGADRAWNLWTAWNAEVGAGAPDWTKKVRSEQIVIEMVDKLIKYGSLSEKQIAFMQRLLVEIDGDVAKMDARQKSRQAERERQLQSRHLGEIGQRTTFQVTVRFAKWIETTGSRFSDGFMITIMDDADGNVLAWMGKGFGYAERDIRGAHVVFTGTIKGHNEREGVKQTQVTRCKVVEISLADAPQSTQDDRGGVLTPAPVSPPYGAGYDDSVDRRDPATVAALQAAFKIV